MKTFVRSSLVLLCLLALPLAAAAQNQNITSGNAQGLMINQAPVEQYLGTTAGTNDAAWFWFETRAGHSYCAETGTAANYALKQDTDTVVVVYAQDATTVKVSDDDADFEPDGAWNSRACWVETVTGAKYAKIYHIDGINGVLTAFHVYETTLYSAFFYTYGDYNTSVQLRNTTSGTVSYTLTFRTTAGAVAGTVSSTLAAGNSVNVSARSYVAANLQGSIELTHSAAPGALQANATTLSPNYGLSFAGPFAQRPVW